MVSFNQAESIIFEVKSIFDKVSTVIGINVVQLLDDKNRFKGYGLKVILLEKPDPDFNLKNYKIIKNVSIEVQIVSLKEYEDENRWSNRTY